MRTYYEVLGVSRSAYDEELDAAWRRLAHEHHPDKGGDASTFAEVRRAASVLRNPDERAKYDLWLDTTGVLCEACGGYGVTWRSKGFTSREEELCRSCKGCGRVRL